jgi:hypothetical protein
MRVTIFTFIFGTGYLFAYLKKIIAATADGDPHMPDWPEFSEWQADIVAPMFQFVVISLLSFGPALVFQIWGEWADWDYPWLSSRRQPCWAAFIFPWPSSAWPYSTLWHPP